MTVLCFGNSAIVLERVVAIQCDEPFSGDEAVRVFLDGKTAPVELFVEDPEAAYLQLCAALTKLNQQAVNRK